MAIRGVSQRTGRLAPDHHEQARHLGVLDRASEAREEPPVAPGPSMDRDQFLGEVTEAIIAELKAGAPSWVRPWSRSEPVAAPHNAVTGRRYGAINAVLLWQVAAARGYAYDGWVTSEAIRRFGAAVRRGEHPAIGFMCFSAYATTERTIVDDPRVDGSVNARSDSRTAVDRYATIRARANLPAMGPFVLYDVAQVEGVPQRTPRTPTSGSPN